VRSRLAGLDLGLLVQAMERGASVTTGEQVTAIEFLSGLPVLGESELYDDICERLDATNDGERAGAIELALEGLYLARKVAKETDGGEAVYGG
jgi:magnesium chelatase subunit I